MKKILFLLFPLNLLAQKLPEIEALNRVILNQKDSIVYALMMESDDQAKVQPSIKYKYFWYASHDIKMSRGDFSGKLLHGSYTAYYEGKDLKSKGVFRKGLKTGKWKYWYKNGELQSRFKYKKSRLSGKYYQYSPEGVLLVKGRYKKDKLNGVQRTYKDGEVSKERYRKGELREKKEKEKQKQKEKEKQKQKRKGKKKSEAEATSPEAPAPLEEKKPTRKEKKASKNKDEIKIRRGFKILPLKKEGVGTRELNKQYVSSTKSA